MSLNDGVREGDFYCRGLWEERRAVFCFLGGKRTKVR